MGFFKPFQHGHVFGHGALSIVDGRVHSRCVKKLLNLHLHLPSHSAHPRGMLRGLIRGTALRVTRRTTNPSEQLVFLKRYRQQLLRRGYSASTLDPIFQEAFATALTPPAATASEIEITLLDPVYKEDRPLAPYYTSVPKVDAADSLYLHVFHHPLDVNRVVIQQAFRKTVASPRACIPMESIRNHEAVPFGVSRLTIAYHRPRNVRDLIARN
jgi:hypothetical protein